MLQLRDDVPDEEIFFRRHGDAYREDLDHRELKLLRDSHERVITFDRVAEISEKLAEEISLPGKTAERMMKQSPRFGLKRGRA